MDISTPKASFGLNASGTITRPWESGNPVIGLPTTDVPLSLGNVIFSAELFLQDVTDDATLNLNDFSTTTDADTAVAATLTTNLAGFNNDLVYTALKAGADGNSITVAYTAPVATGYTTTATITNDNLSIVVTTGAKARMTITGFTGGGAVANLTYHYNSISNGRPKYTAPDGFEIEFTGSNWYIRDVTPGPTVNYAIGTAPLDAATPDLVTSWTPAGGIGTPTVTAGISDASQVSTAIAANEDVADIVSVANASSNDGTGAVTTMAATNLSGGIDANGWVGADLDFNADEFENNSAIHGVLFYCASGRIKIECGTDFVIGVPAGTYTQTAMNPLASDDASQGLVDLLNTFTFTAEADDTRVLVAVVSKA